MLTDAAELALRTLRPADFPYEPIADRTCRHRQLDALRLLVGR